MTKVLLTKEVAEALRVSEEYIRELIRHGKLIAYKEGRRGGYRILERDVWRYIESKLNDKIKRREQRETEIIE